MRIGVVRPLALALVGLVVLAACGASPGSGQFTSPSDGTTAPSPVKSPPAAGSTAPGATGSGAATAGPSRAAFLSYAFTDVRDGKQFKLSDFAGKQVLVIGMAVW